MFNDTKTGEPPVLYLPAELAGAATPAAISEFQTALPCQLEHLPARITRPGEIDPATLPHQRPSVPPQSLCGPRRPVQRNVWLGQLFHHPWSACIGSLSQTPILQSGLAKGMVENFFFEIEHYGGVLNANRTYYLTRSQPPFLTLDDPRRVLKLRQHLRRRPRRRRAFPTISRWLANAYTYAVRDYEQWTQPPHLAGATGLARYFDRGSGPVPEIMDDPSHYYRGVTQYFLIHGDAGAPYLVYPDLPPPRQARSARPRSSGRAQYRAAVVGPALSRSSMWTCASPQDLLPASRPPTANCAPPQNVALAAEFYKGDRSLRESGFDVTFRFGPFGADTHHFAPVCLNSLLYKTEKDLEAHQHNPGQPHEARRWRMRGGRAAGPHQQISMGCPPRDIFRLRFHYRRSLRLTNTPPHFIHYGPAWLRPEQAAAVARNLCALRTKRRSGHEPPRVSGAMGLPLWLGARPFPRRRRLAPLRIHLRGRPHFTASFSAPCCEICSSTAPSAKNMMWSASSQITHINAGYAQNVIGFGWTNGVFLELWRQLPPTLELPRMRRLE